MPWTLVSRIVATSCLLMGCFLGCAADLDLDPDTEMVCASDVDCPKDWTCNLTSLRCLKGNKNTAPVVSIGSIPRGTSTVDIPVTSTDAEMDLVELEMEFAWEKPTGLSEWHPVLPQYVSPDITSLPGDGGEVTLVWNNVESIKA